MAVVTLKTAGAGLVANATNMAAQSGGTVTADQLQAIGRLLAVMDDDKVLAPLLKLSATDKGNISTSP